MWVTAVFGMALKFAECTLSVHYRTFDDRGDAAGGPMYYIEMGLGRAWKPLAVMFAFCAVIASFGGGNMNQANTVAVSARSDFGIASWIVGLVLVVLVGAVILGGIRSIGRVTSRLAPSMALLYVSAAMIILVMNAAEVPGAFATIVSNAFNPQAGVGGSVAGAFMVTLLWGVKRGLFSNEAGQGSAPIAHAAAKTDEPVREGAVAMARSAHRYLDHLYDDRAGHRHHRRLGSEKGLAGVACHGCRGGGRVAGGHGRRCSTHRCSMAGSRGFRFRPATA